MKDDDPRKVPLSTFTGLLPSKKEGFEAIESRTSEAARQLLCGGVAGSVAKTVTAPFSRLTMLFQVHSMVTTKEHRPKFAMSLSGGLGKMIERGGYFSLWQGNATSVLHRFPYSAINFYVYEHTLDALSVIASTAAATAAAAAPKKLRQEKNETHGELVRRVTRVLMSEELEEEDIERRVSSRKEMEETPALHKFLAGATAGSIACLACYPLDLVRARLTTEIEGKKHYSGMFDAFAKITKSEGLLGFYSGVGPTLLVAVPNLAISYTVYGTLKEYTLDDELFYNMRKIDADSGEPKLGFFLTIACGAASGILASMVTFPMDTIRRRMQIQALHFPPEECLTSYQHVYRLATKEGLGSLYRGLTPELLKVVPMVGTMFMVYEWTKDMLNVRHDRR
jgi:solute carrier family 25 phosphate transporter 23/24/25/41